MQKERMLKSNVGSSWFTAIPAMKYDQNFLKTTVQAYSIKSEYFRRYDKRVCKYDAEGAITKN